MWDIEFIWCIGTVVWTHSTNVSGFAFTIIYRLDGSCGLSFWFSSLLYVSGILPHGCTRYWDGGWEVLQIMVSKRNLRAKSNLGFAMSWPIIGHDMVIVLKFCSVILSMSSPLGTFHYLNTYYNIIACPLTKTKKLLVWLHFILFLSGFPVVKHLSFAK